MTAYSGTDKAMRAIKAGTTGFTPKSWEKEKLLATLSQYAQKRIGNCFKFVFPALSPTSQAVYVRV